MVGVMAGSWGVKAESLLNSVKGSVEIPAKMEQLRQLKEVLLHRDPSLLPEFASLVAELHAGQPSPVRKFLAEMIGDIGLKYIDLLPEMVPTLISFLKDETPAVARQAITSGTSLFRIVLGKVAIQGLYSSELDNSLESSWAWMLRFKDAVFPIAFHPGIDGVRLLAMKFVEALILLYTPEPNGSSEPPHEESDGLVFNISWLCGGHPLLNVGDLAKEASNSLGLLLDQLRFPRVKSISNSIIIVLINSLSTIAMKRPSFYGRILPVLLSLDPESSVIKGVKVSGAYHALKNAFVACLKCTHPGAAPWRARLVEALKAMNAGELADQAVYADRIRETNAVSREESYSSMEEKLPLQACDEVLSKVKKRPPVEENDDLVKDEGTDGKRPRPNPDLTHSNHPLTGDGDSGPVQRLVGMFGALVAQGDKATQPLEILISSISSDLLAEVVMANMRHLPTTCPKTEGEEEVALSLGYFGSLVGDRLSFPQIASLLAPQSSASCDISHGKDEKPEITVGTTLTLASSSMNDAVTTTLSANGSIPSRVQTLPVTEDSSVVPLFIDDAETLDSDIPGLQFTNHIDGIQESMDASHSFAPVLEVTSQEQVTSLDLPLDSTSSGCLSTYGSEMLSPRASFTDASQASSTTSGVLPSQYFLPKMTAPVVSLTDEQKDCLQKVAFVRITEAYKQIAVAGGSHIRSSLLACLGVEFPLELDSWGLLQKHILSDYLNHEGQELTLRVLYRLFREAEQDQDFFSSTTATSIYETFLLTVAETLRDSFPASDKSLNRLLAEVPYLPKGVLKLLECLCCPESNAQNDKDFQSGDRVTQGLSAVWSLILLRPSNRDVCLKIALQSAVHHLEEVRMKAIRLVANKLFPILSIAQKIEEFANEMLLSVVDDFPAVEAMDAEGSNMGLQKDTELERLSNGGQPPVSTTTDELTSDSLQLCSTQSASSSSISEAQRRMSLYFALCTKKHSLLRQIFAIYKSMPKTSKQAVCLHIPILVRTIGSSSEMISIISDPPSGSENLLMQVLHTLTDGAIPSQDLIFSVRSLYDSKLKDVEILIPILPFLSKDEVLPIFPQLVNLPLDKFQGALARMLQGSPHTGPSLAPAEVLIAIHGIDPEKDEIPLKKVMDACSACFEQRQVFTQQVLAKVLNQLVEQIPLPLLFMRTVIQAIGAFPALVDFVMEILSRLVSKQIWKYPKLWVGFLKCAVQTKPQSLNVLLQLPAAQLENALNRNPALKSPLIEHANQPNIRSTLPRSTLVVLGLAPDSQTSSQAQTTQSQAVDTSNSAADAGTEVTQEASAVG